MGLKIIGTGSSLPDRIVDNNELAQKIETSDEWIRERTGIHSRHMAGDGESVATLGAKAALKAMDMAKITADRIDLILLATCSYDENTPSAACRLAGIIGAENAAAIDINAACTGFMTALTIADGYLRSGAFKNILIIGGETLSRIVDWNDRTTCILFGDGAGAVLVTDDEKSGIIYTLGADGTKGDALYGKKGDFIHMDGKAVYRFATTTVPKCIDEVLAKAEIKPSDVDLYLLHQANCRIIETIAKNLGEPEYKFPMNLSKYGNMSSASIPVLMDELVRNGKIRKNMKLLLSGFGAGLTYGACLVEWGI